MDSSGADRAVERQTNESVNVTFENQTTAGDAVTVASVRVPDGGFVAIHTEGLLEGNVLDSIVGVSEYLEPGSQTDVRVPLNESLNESQTLIAVIYRDTNANQTFDFVKATGQEDTPYTVENRVVADDAVVEVVETTPTPTTTEEEEEEVVTETPTPTETEEIVETTTTTTTEDVVDTTTTTEPVETTPPVETTVGEAESFEVEGVEFPGTVTQGEPVRIEFTVVNPNDRAVTQPIEIRIDGTVVLRETLTIEPNAEFDVESEFKSADLTPGQHFIEAFTRDEGESAAFEVVEETTTVETTPATTTPEETTPPETETETDTETETTVETTTVEAESFQVEQASVPSSVEVGETMTASVVVVNPNSFEVTQEVEIRLDGTVIDRKEVSLDANEQQEVEFTVETADLSPGDYIVSIFTRDFGDNVVVIVDEPADTTVANETTTTTVA